VERHRYRLDISYDGTAYAGWQVQPNGVTIQEKLEAALRKISGEKVRIHGSGRTDQGVHARRQVAHVDLAKERPAQSLAKSLNAVLPADIRVLAARRASSQFHARYSAVGKEYRYFIWNDPVVPPFLRNYRTVVRDPLDIDAMRRAARYLTGKHDFGAFAASPNKKVESSVRTLKELKVDKRGKEVVIVAKADGFLYKMVRSLAGHLMRVGEGAVPASETPRILSSRRRTARVQTAPPEGLFLWRVQY